MNKGKSFYFRYGGLFSKSNSLSNLIDKSGIKIIFPFYHAVSDDALPHIQNLYSYPSVKKFISDLDLILKYFEPMHPDELKDLSAISKNKFLLSFDDGLREMYEIVAPVLKQKGIPALFFINSDFINNRKLFFRYKVSFLIDQLELSSAEKNRLLHFNYAETDQIDLFAEKNGIDFNAFLNNQKPYVSTEQIKLMYADGFIFGGHSIDHPQYNQINLEEQIRQTTESIKFVQSVTGKEQNYFAFPFTDAGVGQDFFRSINENPELKLSATFGTTGLSKPTGTHLQRIPMEVNGLSAKQILNNEYRWYLIKKMFGR